MSTATIRVSVSTRDELKELAKRLGRSVQSVLEEAIEAYRRRSLPEPARDPNLVAFEALGQGFVSENAGKHAAFCRGRLVALSSDRAEVFAILARDHPKEPCLVKELTLDSPRVVHFRRPRRMTKPNSHSATRHSTAPG